MIADKIRETIRKYRLLNKGERVVIGVSGGPDSLALALILHKLKAEFKLNLHIAHLDHMLRKDSAKDAAFVKEFADKLKVPATIGRINISLLAKKGSLEEIARNARLGFLFGAARKIKAKKIALGHTIDDQAETVLMRILRGTGLYGLSGILPKRNIAGFEIIRPLIEIRRSQIESFLKNKRIKPRLDASNLQDIYFRNKIRNNLLPLLEKKYSPNIKELLANMAQSTGCDYDYLDLAARRATKGLKYKIPLLKLNRMHQAIRRIAIRKILLRLKGDTRRLTFRHIREIEDQLLHRPAGSIVDLPKGLSVAKRKNHLYFSIKKS